MRSVAGVRLPLRGAARHGGVVPRGSAALPGRTSGGGTPLGGHTSGDDAPLGGGVPRIGGRLAVAAALAGVLAQIAHPLLDGPALRAATILSVVLLATASVAHAGSVWGPRGAWTTLAVAGGVGLAAETVGVHTGFPFGTYAYADSLGPRLAGVPLVVPLAWTMLAYPCLLLGRRLTRSAPGPAPLSAVAGSGAARARVQGTRAATSLVGGTALAAWDLFLDPQMVAAGHWAWAHPSPGLPGVPGVPLTNYLGWVLVSIVMIALLDRALPAGSPGQPTATSGLSTTGELSTAREFTPAAVLGWTWAGSTVGNLVFFDRPWVALYGGVVMGSVVLPYLLLLARQHRSTAAWPEQLTRGRQRPRGPLSDLVRPHDRAGGTS